ncbi:ZIP family metal transporter [Candidatus Woesearchaeota archaeon]|nr:ZIP family metal transporter [Candidatus Woesearchaeota archaeon]
MVAYYDLWVVFIFGLITALATGLGALPFFFTKKIPEIPEALLYGIAIGVMMSVSVLGLVPEGLKYGTVTSVSIGIISGALFLHLANHLLPHQHNLYQKLTGANKKSLFLIVGVLTVHSLPEGFAVGTAFAGSKELFWLVFLAISIHNIPEGLGVSVPMALSGASKWRMVFVSIFTSLPQPIGAVIAYLMVTSIKGFLPFSFGFAAGAMIMMVLYHMSPADYHIKKKSWASIGTIIGLSMMIILDVSFKFLW